MRSPSRARTRRPSPRFESFGRPATHRASSFESRAPHITTPWCAGSPTSVLMGAVALVPLAGGASCLCPCPSTDPGLSAGLLSPGRGFWVGLGGRARRCGPARAPRPRLGHPTWRASPYYAHAQTLGRRYGPVSCGCFVAPGWACGLGRVAAAPRAGWRALADHRLVERVCALARRARARL
jgi:hypothetical protein